MSLIQVYLDLQKEYSQKYGEKTVLLMQVGSFYEVYGVPKQDKTQDLANACRLIRTKKNKSNPVVSVHNPWMVGFPIAHLEKFVEILIKNDYTVAVHIQVKNGEDSFDRPLYKIYSKSTVLNDSSVQNSWACALLIEQVKNINIISLGVVDISTGASRLYYYSDNYQDKNLAFDSAYKTLQMLSPVEMVIYNTTQTITEKQVKNNLNISKIPVLYFSKIPKIYKKSSYQEKIFSRIFKNNSALNYAENLDLEKHPSLLLVFVLLLNFVYEHDTTIVKNIRKPDIIFEQEIGKVQLLGDTISQLDLYNTQGMSLFKILAKTSTNMGKRLLKEHLLNPITDVATLQKRYSYISALKLTNYKEYEKTLRDLPDLEKYHRKLSLGLLLPNEFIYLNSAYASLKKMIIQMSKDPALKPLFKDLFNKKAFVAWKNFMKNYRDEINLEKAYDFKRNFFRKGVFPELDSIQENIDEADLWMEKTRLKLCKETLAKRDPENSVKLQQNDDGHVFTMTLARSVNVKKSDLHFELSLEYKNLKSTCKVSCPKLSEMSEQYVTNISSLEPELKEKYTRKIEKWYKKYRKVLDWVVDFVSRFDVAKSNARCAVELGYCEPKILSDKKQAFLDVKNIRHPIVEKIQEDTPFVCNDVEMSEERGRIIFGLNSAGKSTYLRAVGLSVIMAQAGMYVPAETYEFYPVSRVISKIANRDNILTGKSTFVVELEHMRNMIQRSDENTLILGDELCSGTERPSAVALVTSIVEHLKMQGSLFLFSTHFHDLVNTVKNVPFSHFKISLTEEGITFDRILEEGSGQSIYGVEIAKCLGLKTEVINQAFRIRKNLLEETQEIVPGKTSRYNTDLVVDECTVCGSKEDLHTHHILYQSTADENGMIGHIHKNKKHNLVVLCESCHVKTHDGGLKITGYENKNNQAVLQYEI